MKKTILFILLMIGAAFTAQSQKISDMPRTTGPLVDDSSLVPIVDLTEVLAANKNKAILLIELKKYFKTDSLDNKIDSILVYFISSSDTTGKWAPAGAYIFPADTANKWAAKGTYIMPGDTANKWAPKGTYLMPGDTVGRWAPAGTYMLTFDTTARWAPAGIYIMPGDTANKWAPSGTYVLPGDTANKWAPKGTYLMPGDTVGRWAPAGTYMLTFDTTGRWAPAGTYMMPGDTATLVVSKNYGGNQYQPKHANLTSYAGATPSVNALSFLTMTFQAMYAALGIGDSLAKYPDTTEVYPADPGIQENRLLYLEGDTLRSGASIDSLGHPVAGSNITINKVAGTNAWVIHSTASGSGTTYSGTGEFNSLAVTDTIVYPGCHSYWEIALTAIGKTRGDTLVQSLNAYLAKDTIFVIRKYPQAGEGNFYSYTLTPDSLAQVLGLNATQSLPTSIKLAWTKPYSTTTASSKSIDTVKIGYSSANGYNTLAEYGDSVITEVVTSVSDSATSLTAGIRWHFQAFSSTEWGETRLGSWDTCTTAASAGEKVIVMIDSLGYGWYNASQILQSAMYIRDGQSITTQSSTDNIDSVSFWIYKSGSPTGNAYACLFTHSGTYGTSSVGTGDSLCRSEAFDVSTLTTDETKVTFTFTGAQRVSMSPTTHYIIAIRFSGGDGSNYVRVCTDNTYLTHSGNASRYSDSWASLATTDIIFMLWGSHNE